MTDTAKMNHAMFLSWVRFHSRSQGLADALGIPSHFIHEPKGNALLRYSRQTIATYRLLRRERPRTVIVMQPPVVALIVVRLWAFGSRARVVGDLHSGVFLDPKWSWATKLTLLLLRGKHGAIVTNAPLADYARKHSVKAFELHDIITRSTPVPDAAQPEAARSIAPDSLVLVPLAYANDEPVDEVISAARATPSLTWVLTGRAPAAVKSKAPANVIFSGYVTNGEYDWLLRQAAVTVAITTREMTMQCVGYEAMSANRPLVTSNTNALTSFFGDSVIYCDPNSVSIADAVTEAVARGPELQGLLATQRDVKAREQELALDELLTWLSVG